MKRYLSLFLLLTLLSLPAFAEDEEEEAYYVEPPRITSAGETQSKGTLTVLLPEEGASYEAGGKLTVKAAGGHLARIEAVLSWENGSLSHEADGDSLEYAFDTTMFYWASTLTVTGYDEDGQIAAQETVDILSPRDKLIADMFALALKNSKDSYYRHAPAQTDTDRGVCKNFVMRLFDTFKDSYRMAEYPDLALHMPKNKSKKDSAPYQYGIEWRDETAEDGSPFYIAAQYKYDDSLTKAENTERCREVLHSVQRGDFFQMCGDYYYGNGPHSLLFMTDWDEESDELHWTDSNMRGDRVNGDRWGYLQYDAVKTAEWFVEAISSKSTYKTRGCTIYRLREDLYIP